MKPYKQIVIVCNRKFNPHTHTYWQLINRKFTLLCKFTVVVYLIAINKYVYLNFEYWHVFIDIHCYEAGNLLQPACRYSRLLGMEWKIEDACLLGCSAV
jgi:hypothetical protein